MEGIAENATKAQLNVYGHVSAVYHEAAETWICPRQDSYTLENFQNAYDDNLIANNSVLPISLSSSSNSSTTKKTASLKLQSTHYNIKIYPKTEDEQCEIELMDDVAVAYIPFDYIQLPESETKNLTPGQAVYPEQGSYTVTYEEGMSEYGPVEPETLTLPVLYAVWPCNKTIPAGLDYEILYEVFLPEYYQNARTASLSSDIMAALEREALNLASGERQTMAVADWGQLIPIATDTYFYHHDDRLNKDIPLEGLKIRFQNGSNVKDAYTDSEGKYNLGLFVNIGDEPTLSIIFESDKWKITNQDKTASKIINLGGVSKFRGKKTVFYSSQFDQPLFEIHRAVNFYYNGTHSVLKSYYTSSQIRIRALNFEDSRFYGRFSYFLLKKPYISICKRNDNDHSKEIGTTLHELGHFIHYLLNDSRLIKYNGIDGLITESWASYVGWHVGETYYKSLGHTIAPGTDITGQARQDWYFGKNTYSPLFVDMVDDYNQHTSNTGYNYDIIKNTPHSAIKYIISNSSDWTSCRSLITINLQGRYSPSVINQFLDYYEPYNVSCYPNPAKTDIQIRLGRGFLGDIEIWVYNLSGTKVISKPLNIPTTATETIVTLNLSNLSSGSYTVKVKHNNGTGTSRFTKL